MREIVLALLQGGCPPEIAIAEARKILREIEAEESFHDDVLRILDGQVRYTTSVAKRVFQGRTFLYLGNNKAAEFKNGRWISLGMDIRHYLP